MIPGSKTASMVTNGDLTFPLYAQWTPNYTYYKVTYHFIDGNGNEAGKDEWYVGVQDKTKTYNATSNTLDNTVKIGLAVNGPDGSSFKLTGSKANGYTLANGDTGKYVGYDFVAQGTAPQTNAALTSGDGTNVLDSDGKNANIKATAATVLSVDVYYVAQGYKLVLVPTGKATVPSDLSTLPQAVSPDFGDKTYTDRGKWADGYTSFGTNSQVKAVTTLVGASVTLPTDDKVERNGYKLLGWSETAGATTVGTLNNVTMNAGSTITMPADDLVLYPVWEASKTELNIYGPSTDITDGVVMPTYLQTHVNSSLGQPAQSAKITYRDLTSTADTNLLRTDDKVKLPTANEMRRNGYTLIGFTRNINWNQNGSYNFNTAFGTSTDEQDDYGATMTPGAEIQVWASTQSTAPTIYAVWKPNPISLIYYTWETDANGEIKKDGNGKPEAVQKEYARDDNHVVDEKVDLNTDTPAHSVTAPSITGYRFLGWTTDSNASSQITYAEYVYNYDNTSGSPVGLVVKFDNATTAYYRYDNGVYVLDKLNPSAPYWANDNAQSSTTGIMDGGPDTSDPVVTGSIYKMKAPIDGTAGTTNTKTNWETNESWTIPSTVSDIPDDDNENKLYAIFVEIKIHVIYQSINAADEVNPQQVHDEWVSWNSDFQPYGDKTDTPSNPNDVIYYPGWKIDIWHTGDMYIDGMPPMLPMFGDLAYDYKTGTANSIAQLCENNPTVTEITVTADWIQREYKIHFDVASPTGNVHVTADNTDVITFHWNDSIYRTPTEIGYSLDGFSTFFVYGLGMGYDIDSSSTLADLWAYLHNNDPNNFSDTDETSIAEVYGTWNQLTYTLEYDAGSYGQPVANESPFWITAGLNRPVIVTDPNYQFVGWFTGPNGTGTMITSTTPFSAFAASDDPNFTPHTKLYACYEDLNGNRTTNAKAAPSWSSWDDEDEEETVFTVSAMKALAKARSLSVKAAQTKVIDTAAETESGESIAPASNTSSIKGQTSTSSSGVSETEQTETPDVAIPAVTSNAVSAVSTSSSNTVTVEPSNLFADDRKNVA